MQCRMTEASSDERLISAIGRIEHAISRLEHTAVPASAVASAAADPALIGRHERLRATMQEAIARIDLLIDRQQEG